jgi:integrase
LILFGLYTGQRLSDLVSLCWNNIDLPNNQIRFVAAKTNRPVILPIAPPLRKHLESLPSSDNLAAPLHPRAFQSLRHGGGRPGPLSCQFGELLVQAGLRPKTDKTGAGQPIAGRRYREYALSFHSLRHTTVSFLHAAGLPQSVAMEFAGHSSAKAHSIYTHTGLAALQQAADALPELGPAR